MKYKNKEIIIVLAFGKRNRPYGDTSRHSNLCLAYLATGIGSDLENHPMYIQKEVAECFDTSKYLTSRKGLVKIIERDSLDIHKVINQIEIEPGIDYKAILIAHPVLISKATAILERKLIEVEVPIGVRNIPFDPKSTIWWTRGPIQWWLREIPLRILYKIKKFF